MVVLDLKLNLLHYKVGVEGEAVAITTDGKYLYVAGCEGRGWRVEKRRLDDLSLIKVYKSNPTEGGFTVYGIDVNPVTGRIWVVGKGYWTTWRIEVLNSDLELVALRRSLERTIANSITFDDEGNAYVIGYDSIVKYNKEANELKRKILLWNILHKGLWVNGKLYVIGSEIVKGLHRYAVYIFDEELRLIDRVILGTYTDVRSSWSDLCHDDRGIYLCGWEYALKPPDSKWVICSISLN